MAKRITELICLRGANSLFISSKCFVFTRRRMIAGARAGHKPIYSKLGPGLFLVTDFVRENYVGDKSGSQLLAGGMSDEVRIGCGEGCMLQVPFVFSAAPR